MRTAKTTSESPGATRTPANANEMLRDVRNEPETGDSVRGGRSALLERQMALLVLLARPARAGIVPSHPRTCPHDRRGRVLHGGPARGARRLPVCLDRLLLAPLRQ